MATPLEKLDRLWRPLATKHPASAEDARCAVNDAFDLGRRQGREEGAASLDAEGAAGMNDAMVRLRNRLDWTRRQADPHMPDLPWAEIAEKVAAAVRESRKSPGVEVEQLLRRARQGALTVSDRWQLREWHEAAKPRQGGPGARPATPSKREGRHG